MLQVPSLGFRFQLLLVGAFSIWIVRDRPEVAPDFFTMRSPTWNLEPEKC